MNQRQFNSFADFWPHYLSEHGQPITRALHATGTIIALGLLIFLIATGRWWLFTHPLWSFMGDWKMLALMLAGKINDEVSRIHNNPR